MCVCVCVRGYHSWDSGPLFQRACARSRRGAHGRQTHQEAEIYKQTSCQQCCSLWRHWYNTRYSKVCMIYIIRNLLPALDDVDLSVHQGGGDEQGSQATCRDDPRTLRHGDERRTTESAAVPMCVGWCVCARVRVCWRELV